jgi:glycerol-3-phosphate acyltransferase PlsY
MPIKYKFKGGKGVACVAAVILMTDLGNAWHLPITFFVMLTMFALIALGLKFVSLASVMCMLVYPLMMHEMEMLIQSSVGVVLTESGIYTIIALMMALLIVFMHRENIKRLLNGTESKLDLKGKKKTLYAESVEENATQKTTEAEDEIAEEPTKAKRSPNPDRPNPNTSKKKQKRNKK